MNMGENKYRLSKNDGPQGKTINTISYKATPSKQRIHNQKRELAVVYLCCDNQQQL